MNFFTNRIAAINKNFGLSLEKQNECWHHTESVLMEKCAFDYEVSDSGIRLEEEEDFICKNTQFDTLQECTDHLETEFLTEYNHEAQRIQHHGVEA